MTTLLDVVAAKLQADAHRWPDRHGNYHADCPYCHKPAKKGQTHFCISAKGLCYCQVCQQGTTLHALAEHLGIAATSTNGARPETTYDYYDAAGVLAYQVVRYYRGANKHFFQRRPNGADSWVNNLQGVDRVLYHLPELIQAIARGETIYIAEGEKDVEMLRVRGLAATTNVAGAGKWQNTYSEALRGADVVILPDNDTAGQQHAQQVRQSLQGIARSVKVVRLPSLPDKGDVSDWLAQGHTAEELRALVAKPVELVVDRRREGITLAELQNKHFDPERWIVENILPEGACVFAAKYKSKKSWMALAISLAVSMGGRALGQLAVYPGRVLYLDLEGRQQRIQKRTRAMLGVRQTNWPANFHVYTKWSQGDEGLAELEHWLMAHPDTALVIIDVMASFRRPIQKHEEVYRYDRDTIDPINELAERFHVAILLVHHFNKGKHDDIMDSITGSTGIPSAVNTMWGLRRDPNDSSITVLELRGRDLENEDPIALRWDVYLNQHIIEGPANEVAVSAERKAVLKVLDDDVPRTPKEIAGELGKPTTAVQQLLRKLLNEGLIDKAGWGKYAIVRKADQNDQNDQSSQNDQNGQSSDSDRDSSILIGGEVTDQNRLKHQDNGKADSDRSDHDSNGSIFDAIPDVSQRMFLRNRLRSNNQKDQEIARTRCEAYGIDYNAALLAARGKRS